MRYSYLFIACFTLFLGCTKSDFEQEVRSFPNEFIEASINGTVIRADAVPSGYINDTYRYTEDSLGNFIVDLLQISRQTENHDYQFNILVGNQTLHQQTFPITVTPSISSGTDASMTVFQSPRSDDIQLFGGGIEMTITNWGPDNIMEGSFNGVLTQIGTMKQLKVEDGSFRIYVVKDID